MNDARAEAEAAAWRHLDGAANDGDRARLSQMIIDDPEFRGWYVNTCTLHALMDARNGGRTAPLPQAQAPLRWRRWLPLPMAAALVLLLVSLTLMPVHHRWRVVSGTVTDRVGGTLGPGADIPAGADFGVVEGSARIVCDDDSVTIHAGAQVAFADGAHHAGPQPALLLDHGVVDGDVLHDGAGSFIIGVPSGTLTAVGHSRFTVDGDAASARVTVDEGSLLLDNRTGKCLITEHAAGDLRRSVAPQAAPWEVQAFSPFTDEPCPWILLQDRDDGLSALTWTHAADWPGPTLRVPVIGAGERSWAMAMRSSEAAFDWRGWDGLAVWIKLPSLAEAPAWSLEIVNSHAPGARSGYDSERFNVRRTATEAGWRLEQVPFNAFTRRSDFQPPLAPHHGLDLGDIHGLNIAINGKPGQELWIGGVMLYRDRH
jgi:ferric-dicitrate binding protein FerR (iron transport regulator)